VEAARRLIFSVSDEHSYFPSVSSDDGGLVVYWKVGGASLQVDLLDDGRFYARIADSARGIDEEYYEDSLPFDRMRDALRGITERANAVNPDWRTLF
jgi:hypothetical protein